MKCIDKMIQRIQGAASRYDDDYMIAHLELAKKLCEISKNADTSAYVDKIAQTFCEILETQQDIIKDLKYEIDQLNLGTEWRTMTPVGAQSNYIPALQSTVGKKEEDETFLEVPEGGEFKNSLQVKESFIAYLKKIRKNGKPLSHTTVYDYSSRINMLFIYFEKEWKSGKLEGKLQIEEGQFIPGESYLNVYKNIDLFEAFIRDKAAVVKLREAEGNPFSAEELAESPLNAYKNVNNTSAALAKFRAFQVMVDKIVKTRGDV